MNQLFSQELHDFVPVIWGAGCFRTSTILPIHCSSYINKLSASRLQISLFGQFTYSEKVPHAPSHSVMTTLSTDRQPL